MEEESVTLSKDQEVNLELSLDFSEAMDAINGQQDLAAAEAITNLGAKWTGVFDTDWLDATVGSLRSQRFDQLSPLFIDRRFIGPRGHVLIVGPYTQVRGGVQTTCLSALLGVVCDYKNLHGLAAEVQKVQGDSLRQPFQPVIATRFLAACGNLGGEQGEAFVVPDGWGWQGSAFGPALNDMTEQRRRFELGGRRCVEQIFDAETAALILAPIDRPRVGDLIRHRSYDVHDVGHVSGLGYVNKLEQGLLPNYWYRAVEEWRADGVAFEVAARILGEIDASNDLAANLSIRFGMDAHRLGGVDGDVDVCCTLLMLDRMLTSGTMKVRNGRLTLADPTPRGLVRALASDRADTIELTRRELALAHPMGLLRLYGSVSYAAESESVLEEMVRAPCRAIFTDLR
jgi:hypothetical protein